MDKKRSPVTGILAAVAMAALIIDPRTSLLGAGAGVELCIQTVIPSLFPFFILSILLTESLAETKSRALSILGRWCGMPAGAESILLVGLLGGYPVGAQCVCQAYTAGRLGRTDARRMLGFCSNAGPAFLFGMVASRFQSRSAPFVLWGIHILSALIVGFLLPGKQKTVAVLSSKKQMSLGQAMEHSVRTMACVCGWVVLFRVIITFFDRWFLWLLDREHSVLLTGILELTNGCVNLTMMDCEGMRFILAALFLGFGGICVGMQTVSVTTRAGLGTGLYFPGKILQGAISTILACPVMFLLYPEAVVNAWIVAAPVISGVVVLFLLKNGKINSSIPALSGV